MQDDRRMMIFNKTAALKFVDHDENILEEIARLFLDDTPGQMAKLEESFAGGDLKTAERLAHSVKGSALNLGAEALVEAASRAEKALNEANVGESATAIEDMTRCCEALKPCLAAII